MKPLRIALLPAVLSFVVLGSGCSGDDTSGTGGAGGGTNDTGAGGTGATAGTGGNSGTPGGVDCSGSFGGAAVVLDDGARVATPSITADELVLFYTRGDSGGERFYVSQRASVSEAFPVGASVPELDAACQTTDDRSLDVSGDGLTAYVSCYPPGTLAEPTTLYVLTRASQTEPFGSASEAGSMTPSSSVEEDGLSAVWSGEASPSTRLATRTSTTESFGNDTALPGLETTNVHAPDLSPDGLAVYGGIDVEGIRTLAASTRASTSEPFRAPEVLSGLISTLLGSGAPDLSADCRSLYFVGVDAQGMYRIYRATR